MGSISVDLKQLQSYKFVSVQVWCCMEAMKIMRLLPLLFIDHYVERISAPTRKINLNLKMRMGELEENVCGIVSNIDNKRKQYDLYCVNFVPLLSIAWIQQHKTVSPYLIKAATGLFKKIDLLVIPGREDILGRNGDKSWFVRSEKVKKTEGKIDMWELLYDNNIDYISLNKLLEIARENNLWK